jgi:ribosomal protein L12E/L44/L45/RPP1/RPP2
MFIPKHFRPLVSRVSIASTALLLLLISLGGLSGCGNNTSSGGSNEYEYVAVPEASLRDRVATIYNKTGLVHNGERLEVLEHMQNKRFVRVRTPRGEEGWIQERYLADQATFDQFQRLAEQNKNAPAHTTADDEDQAKVQIMPGRKTGYLYHLAEKQKVDLLQRQVVKRNAPAPTPAKDEKSAKDDKNKDKDKDKDKEDSDDDDSDKSDQPAILEDWWLVRDQQKRVGWVYGRTLYVDVPDEIAQYSEGQRIVSAFPLNEVQDEGKTVKEYVVLFTEAKDGMPFDFNQVRVFTWNTRKHRYETAYRERDLNGVLPVTQGQQDFGKEGTLRTFTLRVKDEQGNIHEQVYKFNPPIVRKYYAPGETPIPKMKHKPSEAAQRKARH